MSRPMVGIAARFIRDEPTGDLSDAGTGLRVLDAVTRAGGHPVVLCSDDADHAVEAVSRMSAMLFPGGGDSDPTYYGDDWRHPKLRLVDPRQDLSDMALLRAALDIGTPTLALCRGMQTLNIVCGGSLVQHLEPGSIDHEETTHGIEVTEPASEVARMIGRTSFRGRSRHQQAVRRLGRDLTITATAPDGCVEAIEHQHTPAVGLQWHPEMPSADGPPQPEPFTWLLQRAHDHQPGLLT